MTHRVGVAAFEAAADPEAYPASGEPWQALKLYYFGSCQTARFIALHREMLDRGMKPLSATILRQWQERADARGDGHEPEITTRIPCADFFAVRDAALRAHATQIDPNGFWFSCPLEVQRAVWPTEDYHLARSVVDSKVPEDDLFAGIREMASV